VLDAHLKQIDRHNRALNAIVTMDVELARARAREADDALTRGQTWGPLHGVPFTLKDAFFETSDVLICPASMTTAFPHCPPGSPLTVDGRPETYWAVSGHGALFNYSGHPAVVVPHSLDAEGLPIGIQVVGRRWDESRLLGMARALTAITGEVRRPTGY
jgi:amidase